MPVVRQPTGVQAAQCGRLLGGRGGRAVTAVWWIPRSPPPRADNINNSVYFGGGGDGSSGEVTVAPAETEIPARPAATPVTPAAMGAVGGQGGLGGVASQITGTTTACSGQMAMAVRSGDSGRW